PRVLGHEISGIIDAVGKNVEGYAPGMRVHVHPGIACGTCYYCKSGYDNLCDHVRIMGFNYDGGFQEYLTIPAEGVQGKIVNIIEDDDLSFEEISFIEPLSCCVNVQENMALEPEDPVRAKQAEAFGFDGIFKSDAEAESQINLLTNGKGVDAVIPCCAATEAMNLGFKLLAKKGCFGHFSGIIQSPNSLPEINVIHYKEQTMVGAYGCGIAHSRHAKALLESGKLIVKDLI
ncbi:MAG: alcohol dehydrogenase catalytic domain-containing protein, partial [Eubacterium sp.]